MWGLSIFPSHDKKGYGKGEARKKKAAKRLKTKKKKKNKKRKNEGRKKELTKNVAYYSRHIGAVAQFTGGGALTPA